jgi:uncharacterized protein
MLSEAKITREMIPAMQGVIPATLATCSGAGITNVTYITQVFYVDDTHVALSFQFMNKTWRNLQENPVATVIITCPATFSWWKLRLRFLEAQTEGPVFDQMDMQLEALASMHRMEGIYQIKSALICRVEQVECLFRSFS